MKKFKTYYALDLQQTVPMLIYEEYFYKEPKEVKVKMTNEEFETCCMLYNHHGRKECHFRPVWYGICKK